MVALLSSLSLLSSFWLCECSECCSTFPRRYGHRPLQHQFLATSPQRLGHTNRFPHALTLRLRDSPSPGLPNSSSGHIDQSFQGWYSKEVTKFIDDNLINAVMPKDGGIRQIVLLTDGMDQRPYNLPWPPSTLIFHVSSGPVVKSAKGAELPKYCLFRHVSADLGEATDLEEGWTERLRRVGYQGDKPSIWAIQGLEHLRSSAFQHVLMSVGRVAMKGSFFVGELPITAIDWTDEETARQRLEKIFMSHGFLVKSVSFKQLAQDDNAVDGVHIRTLFLAEQLRLSDEQVMKAMREIQFAEEAGDEESFEDW